MIESSSRARSIRVGAKTAGTVEVPPSKSHTNRALNLALLVDGDVRISRPLDSEDTRAMLRALGQLGVDVSEANGSLTLSRQSLPEGAAIDCRASGTMLRFLIASLTTVAGTWTLDGTERLRNRPLAPLLEALRSLGGEIECPGTEGFAPVRIRGGSLRGGRASLDAGDSSQFLSALLMAAVGARKRVEIEVSGLVSAPYVEMTIQAMADVGLKVKQEGNRFWVAPQQVSGARIAIEGDYSSACYFGAAAALTRGSITLTGLRSDSVQGDARFFSVLEAMGAASQWGDGVLQVRGPERLEAVQEDFSDIPDQVPTLAALAPFAAGTTRVVGVGHLRLKESDRLEVVARELGRAGVAPIEESADALAIPGLWSVGEPPRSAVTIDPTDDHRIAMSLAVFGLVRPGLSIAHPEVVSKSYPDFWRDFAAVCEPGGR